MADVAVGFALSINRRIKLRDRSLWSLVDRIKSQSPLQYAVDGSTVFVISNTGSIGGFTVTSDPDNLHTIALPVWLIAKQFSAVGGYHGQFYALAGC